MGTKTPSRRYTGKAVVTRSKSCVSYKQTTIFRDKRKQKDFEHFREIIFSASCNCNCLLQLHVAPACCNSIQHLHAAGSCCTYILQLPPANGYCTPQLHAASANCHCMLHLHAASFLLQVVPHGQEEVTGGSVDAEEILRLEELPATKEVRLGETDPTDLLHATDPKDSSPRDRSPPRDRSSAGACNTSWVVEQSERHKAKLTSKEPRADKAEGEPKVRVTEEVSDSTSALVRADKDDAVTRATEMEDKRMQEDRETENRRRVEETDPTDSSVVQTDRTGMLDRQEAADSVWCGDGSGPVGKVTEVGTAMDPDRQKSRTQKTVVVPLEEREVAAEPSHNSGAGDEQHNDGGDPNSSQINGDLCEASSHDARVEQQQRVAVSVVEDGSTTYNSDLVRLWDLVSTMCLGLMDDGINGPAGVAGRIHDVLVGILVATWFSTRG